MLLKNDECNKRETRKDQHELTQSKTELRKRYRRDTAI